MSAKALKPPIPKLVVLSAPSGAGKSTLVAMLLEKHSNLKVSISYTTRPPRGQEKHGEHYFFVSDADFQKLVAGGEFLEHAQVFGKHWYGTSKKKVEKTLSEGNSVLFDIDVQGAQSLKKAFKKECITIFVLPPSIEELEKRLRNRQTETPEAIEARMKTAREELKQASTFDYQLVNMDLKTTVAEIEAVLKKEGCL